MRENWSDIFHIQENTERAKCEVEDCDQHIQITLFLLELNFIDQEIDLPNTSITNK